MTNKFLILIASAMVFFGCNGPNSATSNTGDSTSTASDTSAWVSLFDGKSTAGWHSYGKSEAGDLWKVADGVLYLDSAKKDGFQTSGGGDLVTDGEYENFHLKYEWKISPNGNSGVIFLLKDDTAKYQYVWYTGLEMQVLHNEGHPDGKLVKHRAGDLYDVIASSKETVKPVGEWNEAEIIHNNDKLDLFLNGTNVVSTTIGDSTWKRLIAGSKFKDMPDFATYKKGKIALQDHGNMMWFRNIKIKQL